MKTAYQKAVLRTMRGIQDRVSYKIYIKEIKFHAKDNDFSNNITYDWLKNQTKWTELQDKILGWRYSSVVQDLSNKQRPWFNPLHSGKI